MAVYASLSHYLSAWESFKWNIDLSSQVLIKLYLTALVLTYFPFAPSSIDIFKSTDTDMRSTKRLIQEKTCRPQARERVNEEKRSNQKTKTKNKIEKEK